jgi:hypothetical protein
MNTAWNEDGTLAVTPCGFYLFLYIQSFDGTTMTSYLKVALPYN